jgi:hypothetical protein
MENEDSEDLVRSLFDKIARSDFEHAKHGPKGEGRKPE